MAQSVVINNVTYQNVPKIQSPKQAGGGMAEFVDTSDATLDNGNKMLASYTSYANGVKFTGSIPSKAAQTYTPTTSDQTIAANQYLSGVQTIKGDQNLQPSNIAAGVSIFGVQGALSAATISQDSTTKVLTIS